MKPFVVLAPYLANLPSGWQVHQLRRVATLIDDHNSDAKAQLLSLTIAGTLTERGDEVQPPSVDYLLKYGMVKHGDLVVNPMWLSGGSIGVSNMDGAVSPEYRIYRFGSAVLPRFAHYLVRSDPYMHQYRLLVRAETTFDRRVTKEDFRDLPVFVPPLREQRAIADFLDSETGRIEELITKKSRMVTLLRQRYLAGIRYRMGSLSRQHGDIALKHLVTCMDGRRIPLSAEDRSLRSGPYPYFGASGQIDWIDGYLFDETLVLLGEDGAQLADPDYEISFVISGKTWVNNHAHVLRPTAADPWFLSMHLSTVDRILVISGATREKITQSDMNEIPVPNVPIAEQPRISDELRHLRKLLERSTQALRRQIALLREHRRALMTAAVTGELGILGGPA